MQWIIHKLMAPSSVFSFPPPNSWSPVQSVGKILLSVMSLLAEPNAESPANVDAAVRKDC